MGRIKLNDEQKKKILADYITNQNYSEVARMNGNISPNTVKALVKDNKDFAEKCEQKSEENTKSTLEYMEEQHNLKKELVNNLLQAIKIKSTNVDMFTNVKDLATAYGIIIDKELKVMELKLKKRELDIKNREVDTARKIIIVDDLPNDEDEIN